MFLEKKKPAENKGEGPRFWEKRQKARENRAMQEWETVFLRFHQCVQLLVSHIIECALLTWRWRSRNRTEIDSA